MIMRHTYSSPGPKLLSSTGRPATLNSLGEACSYEEKRKQEKKQIGKIYIVVQQKLIHARLTSQGARSELDH